MMLEYILVFHQDGTSIISKCFAGFCFKLSDDLQTLNNMVIQLSSVPNQFTKDAERIKKYVMGSIELYFHSIGEYFVVLGTTEGQSTDIEDLASDLIGDLSRIIRDYSIKDLHQQISSSLSHWNHLFNQKPCPASDQCPLTFGKTSEPVWDTIQKIYSQSNGSDP